MEQTIHYPRGYGWSIKQPKTTSSQRQVALGIDVMVLLEAHQAALRERQHLMRSEWLDHNLVFPNRQSEPVRRQPVYQVFECICALADLQRICIHGLRHTAATMMLVAGVHPKIVSERLGHSDIGITLQTYSHVTAIMQQAAAETLDTLRPAQIVDKAFWRGAKRASSSSEKT